MPSARPYATDDLAGVQANVKAGLAEVDAARAALEGVPSGPVRAALQAVADQVLDRQV